MKKIFDFNKRRSMRFKVLLFAGAALLLFVLMSSYIIVNNMFELLEKSELEQTAVSSKVFAGAVKIFSVLCFLTILFAAILFYFFNKYVFNPIEMISKDVQAVAVSSESVNTDAYNNSFELNTLSWSINSMLERLALNQEIAMQSTVSFNTLQNILNALDTHLFVADIETSHILFANENFKKHFKLSDAIIGVPCYEAIPFCTKKTKGFCSRDYLVENPDAAIVMEEELPVTGRHYRKTEVIINWAHGRKAYLHYSIDITATKELENGLLQAKETAERANRAKSEFLSRMSHEMRTPMNAIIGMTNIAKNARDLEKKEYCLSKIDEASKHLLGVINDILDMAKIEANRFEIFPNEFNLEKMLIKVISIINFRVEEKKQILSVNLAPDLPQFIISDEQRLVQVITNLLSNAVKFTPENGKINLEITSLGKENDIYTLQFEVEDNGIGISAEQQSRLFHSFEQADNSIARKFGGTGLGLVISKRIIEMLDGKIWIESELGQGAKIIFTVKTQEGKSQRSLLPLCRTTKENLRILAVDDAYDTREYFLNIMKRFEFYCDVAASGYEALALVKANQANPYDIFFIDCMMENMNGIELTKKIREITTNNAIVFMISILEWKEIEQEALAAGVNRFISKPLFPSILLDSIHECLNLPTRGKTAETLISQKNLASHTILLAEDVEVNQEIISGLLEETKIKIDITENGAQALELFKKSPARYSLILMDIHMPEMDGYEATRQIRALTEEKAKTIPIIAMTANVFREDIENCLAAGMDGHIGKPISAEELTQTLHKYLDSAACETDKNITPAVSDAQAEFDYEQLLPVIDVEDGLARVMQKKSLYFTLLNNFKGREMTAELTQNITDNDFTAARRTAHAIKGTALNLGLLALAEAAQDIEDQAKIKANSKHLIVPLNEALNSTLAGIEILFKNEGVASND